MDFAGIFISEIGDTSTEIVEIEHAGSVEGVDLSVNFSVRFT